MVPSDPSAPIRQVAAGRADLAISYEPEVLLAQDQGLPVVAIAAIVDQPLTSLISLARGRDRRRSRPLGQDRSRRPASPTRPTTSRRSSTSAGLSTDDVTQVDVGLNLLPALLSGRADAILGGFLNIEGVDLAERGSDPRVLPVDQLGIPTYDELVLVANTDDIADDPEPVRLFIAALERGTARRDPRPRRRDRGDPRRRRRPRPEADRGRDRGDAAAARAGEEVAAVRLHEPQGVGALRRLLRRPRPDLNAPDGRRDAHTELLPARSRLAPISAALAGRGGGTAVAIL